MAIRAHPHSRGENLSRRFAPPLILGSSPLTRGKPYCGCGPANLGGLIPTHAGKTSARTSRGLARAAHPHSRGENSFPSGSANPPWGSSPLTRGKRAPQAIDLPANGLIPTHAGKTAGRVLRPDRRGAHPHSRGENLARRHVLRCFRGSSPLTRGKRPPIRAVGKRGGLIPTHAGKTSRFRPTRPAVWAHPHSRGENRSRRGRRERLRGSSPLTRGKHPRRVGQHPVPGLIPTHAGKTWTGAWAWLHRRAHPHSRGENQNGEDTTSPRKGSSPLTRGKPWTGRRSTRLRGLIPTHAGKTSRSCSRAARRGAHPHSRGENGYGRRFHLRPRGSSPLTRGKLGRALTSNAGHGLIPTHAGKTH